MSAPEKLSPTDLALVQAAQAELAQAQQLLATKQDVMGFAQAHIARVYQLKNGDAVTVDGTIIRAPEKPADA